LKRSIHPSFLPWFLNCLLFNMQKFPNLSLLCIVESFSNFKTWLNNFSTLSEIKVLQTTKLKSLVDVQLHSKVLFTFWTTHNSAFGNYIQNKSKTNWDSYNTSHSFTIMQWQILIPKHTLVMFHFNLVCPSSTMENQRKFQMFLHKKILKPNAQSKLEKKLIF